VQNSKGGVLSLLDCSSRITQALINVVENVHLLYVFCNNTVPSNFSLELHFLNAI